MTARVIPFPDKPSLSKREAEEWIRAIMLGSGFGPSDHFNERLEERDIPMRMVLEVLKSGDVVAEPKWDQEHEDWVCKVRKTVAGRKVTVIVALEKDNKMTGVTTFG